MTTSHTSILFGTSSETSHTVFGEPRHQRSDEFLRGSPRVIASLRGVDQSSYTPLDVSGSDEYRKPHNNYLGKLVEWSRPPNEIIIEKVAHIAPLRVGFAMLWWASTLLLLVALPLWFKLLGRSTFVGAACALAIFFVSTNAWFSYLPSFLIANAVASASCILFVLDLQRRGWFKGWRWSACLLLGVYGGRFAFTVLQYPPWGFPTAALVGTVTVTAILQKNELRNQWKSLTVFSVAALVSVAAVWKLNSQVFSVVLDTVYPGNRRSTGGVGDNRLFAGAISWFMQSSFARDRNMTNPETAWGPLFLLVPTISLYVLKRHRSVESQKDATTTFAGIVVVLVTVLWSEVQWPDWLRIGNPLVFVPSARAAMITGVLVVIPLFLLLGIRHDKSTTQRKWQIQVGVLVGLTSVAIVSGDSEWMRLNVFAEAGIAVVWWSLAAVFVITYLLVVSQTRVGMLALLLALGLSSVVVNPVTVGVNALEDSAAVETVLDLSRQREGRWATTGFFEDALMISTGVPQLSGQQPFGPDFEAWTKLDPYRTSVDYWNRGQAYINFQWSERSDIGFANPSPDVIQILASPCNAILDYFELTWVVSVLPLNFSCLLPPRIVTWMGAPLYIYGRRMT